MRTMSMEHRWQDLANFLSLPDGANLSSHHHHHHHAHSHGHHHPSLGHSLTPHSHPFAHPYPHPHSPHGSIHNPHGYGVHPAAAAAAAAAAVGHHHYTGAALAPAATPVAAYTNTDAGRTALLQNASMGSPLTEIGTNGTYPSPGHGNTISLKLTRF